MRASQIHQFGIMSAPTTARFCAWAIAPAKFDIERMREQYDLTPRYLLGGLLRSMGLECFEPQGAFYSCSRRSESTGFSSRFCERLLHDERSRSFRQRQAEAARGSCAYLVFVLDEPSERGLQRIQ